MAIDSETARPIRFYSVDGVAYRLGVPSTWLRAEAEAGRVPALRAGKRLLMDMDEVRRALVRRSVETCAENRESVPCA